MPIAMQHLCSILTILFHSACSLLDLNWALVLTFSVSISHRYGAVVEFYDSAIQTN